MVPPNGFPVVEGLTVYVSGLLIMNGVVGRMVVARFPFSVFLIPFPALVRERRYSLASADSATTAGFSVFRFPPSVLRFFSLP